MLGRSADIWIAIVCLALALAAFFIWVPLDSETPPIYTFRRQTYIGDAMLPTVSAAGIAIFAALHLIVSLRRRETIEHEPPFDVLTAVFFALFALIMAAALAALYWTGPLAVSLFGPGGEEPITYRQLRTTVPWKYLGFVIGGFIMVFGITSLIEGRISVKRVLSTLFAIVLLILVFDVPFDTLLLPPNGDF